MKKNRRDIWRVSGSLIAIVLALAVSSLFVKGAVTQPPVGSWNAGANLSQARAGASATLLQDGRILVTGGDDGSGPSNSADFINTDGTISPAPPMLDSRENHISVTLANGDVLVAGGTTTGGGATNSAEIFDPTTNSWTSVAGGMIEARSGATATLLQNGEVLIAGGAGNGAISSTAEIFDPNSPSDGNPNAFTFAGNLSSPRENLAAALLKDGRVLIVGGLNGSAPLATSDIYNPSTGTMSAGPAMPIARQGLSATTLLNGMVLIAGGSTVGNNGQATDLASIELFDPSANAGAGAFGAALDSNGNPVALLTARQGQQAVLLPHNGAVLIFGGTSSGATLASAELFTPSVSSTGAWSYADAATGSMTASRSNFAASSFSNGTPKSIDAGILFAAGGSSTDANGNVTDLSSTDVYGFPWVKTDQADYAPGSTASITGGGFQPGETVVLSFVESPQIDSDGPVTATADSNGKIAASFYVDAQDAGVLFYMTAVGQSSGRQAQTTFTDKVDTTTSVTCAPFVLGQASLCTATVSPTSSSGNVHGIVEWTLVSGSGTFSSDGYNFSPGPPASCTLTTTGATPPSQICSVYFTPSTSGFQLTATYYSDDNGKLTSQSSATLTTATVTVDKTLIPSTDTGTFNLQVDGTTAGTGAAVGDGGTTGPVIIIAGTSQDGGPFTSVPHTIGETAAGSASLGNYNTGIVCADSSGPVASSSTTSVTLTPATGGVYTCTITNTAKPATLVVTKTSVGGVGGFDFIGSGSGVSSSFTLTTVTAGTTVSTTFSNLTPGSGYGVTETVPTGWSLNTLADHCTVSGGGSDTSTSNVSGSGYTITLGAGDTVTCNFTDTKAATLIVTKTSVGGTGTFSFTGSGTGVSSNFTLTTVTAGTAVSTTFSNLAPGSGYGVTETVPTGWSLNTLAASCAVSGGGSDTSTSSVSGSGYTITLGAGDTVTCNFIDTKLATIVLVKNTVGGNGTFSFSATGGLATPSTITTHSGTGSEMFLNLTPGSSNYSFTETVPTGWEGNITNVGCEVTIPGAGGTSIDATNATTGTVAAGSLPAGIVTSPTINTIAAGAVVTCTFTNGTLPTLTVVKDIHGTAATFFFNLNSGSTGGSTANFPAAGISVAANGTGQYQDSIPTGQQTITELLDQTVAAVGGWTLTDAQCTGASGGSSVNLPSATFTANYGDNVVCTFINSNVKTTRTQGFWATHTFLSNAIWNGTPLPPGTTSIPSYPVVGTGDQLLCGVPITAVAATEENQLIGGFWLQPAKTTTGDRRSKIDHDRVTMLQQYLAAVLNFHAFGGVPQAPPGGDTTLSILQQYAKEYCSGTDREIRTDIGILDTFNNQGDTNQFTPGSSATPQTSRAQADLDYWDNPAAPGLLDESESSTTLTTVKNVSGGTASPQDFTLTATCTTTNDCGSAGKRGVLSGRGGFSSAVPVGTYTLTDAGNDKNAAGYSAGSWTCTNVGSGGSAAFALSTTINGTATLAIDAGADLTCQITNTLP